MEQNTHIWKQQVHFLLNFDRWLYCPQIFSNVPNFLEGRGPWAPKLKFLAWTQLCGYPLLSVAMSLLLDMGTTGEPFFWTFVDKISSMVVV